MLSLQGKTFSISNQLITRSHPDVKVPLEGEREPNLEGERESRAEDGISLGLHLPSQAPQPTQEVTFMAVGEPD